MIGFVTLLSSETKNISLDGTKFPITVGKMEVTYKIRNHIDEIFKFENINRSDGYKSNPFFIYKEETTINILIAVVESSNHKIIEMSMNVLNILGLHHSFLNDIVLIPYNNKYCIPMFLLPYYIIQYKGYEDQQSLNDVIESIEKNDQDPIIISNILQTKANIERLKSMYTNIHEECRTHFMKVSFLLKLASLQSEE